MRLKFTYYHRRSEWEKMAFKMGFALAGVAQWIEHGLVNLRVAGLIPSQGTCLGCRPGPQWGMHESQPHIDVSLFLSPSLPFSLKMNK